MVESAAERQARNLAMLERSVQRHREEEEEENFFAMVRSRPKRPRHEKVPKTEAEPKTGADEGQGSGRPSLNSKAAERFVKHHARPVPVCVDESLPMSIQRHFSILGLPLNANEPEVQSAYKRLVRAHETDEKKLKLVAQAHDAICEHLGQKPWSRMPPPDMELYALDQQKRQKADEENAHEMKPMWMLPQIQHTSVI
eukprot:symbB.v1.2.039894.t1/scaffold6855.1/size15029/2